MPLKLSLSSEAARYAARHARYGSWILTITFCGMGLRRHEPVDYGFAVLIFLGAAALSAKLVAVAEAKERGCSPSR
ncbi:MAG: hypothetical protein KGL39_44140 [Patescibacteria group bacterium]|nr:hypothetical protein [Patescibacteria group bacterium]